MIFRVSSVNWHDLPTCSVTFPFVQIMSLYFVSSSPTDKEGATLPFLLAALCALSRNKLLAILQINEDVTKKEKGRGDIRIVE